MVNNSSLTKITCLWCGVPSDIIWVHGHGQCSNCGINIDECCRGENCSSLNLSITENTEQEKLSEKK